MPPAAPSRQPDAAPQDWFEGRVGQALVQQVQRQTIPELTRVFGHTGLYLRPGPGSAGTLSGNMLARVISLHRQGRGYAGDLQCVDGEFPVATASLSLVYALFVLETSADPQALLSEMARMLKPEGTAVILGLNPRAPFRLRWSFAGLDAIAPSTLAGQLRQHGLEVSRQRSVGPVWKTRASEEAFGQQGSAVLAPIRAATLTVARRRDPGLNFIRQSSPGIRLQTGVSTG